MNLLRHLLVSAAIAAPWAIARDGPPTSLEVIPVTNPESQTILEATTAPPATRSTSFDAALSGPTAPWSFKSLEVSPVTPSTATGSSGQEAVPPHHVPDSADLSCSCFLSTVMKTETITLMLTMTATTTAVCSFDSWTAPLASVVTVPPPGSSTAATSAQAIIQVSSEAATQTGFIAVTDAAPSSSTQTTWPLPCDRDQDNLASETSTSLTSMATLSFSKNTATATTVAPSGANFVTDEPQVSIRTVTRTVHEETSTASPRRAGHLVPPPGVFPPRGALRGPPFVERDAGGLDPGSRFNQHSPEGAIVGRKGGGGGGHGGGGHGGGGHGGRGGRGGTGGGGGGGHGGKSQASSVMLPYVLGLGLPLLGHWLLHGLLVGIHR